MPEPERINKEQFQKKLEEFFYWTSAERARPMASWMVSLEQWASQEFNIAYKKEHLNDQ